MSRYWVIYDSRCGFCSRCRRWLQRQAAYVELRFLPMGTGAVRRRFPELDRVARTEEFVVVSEAGEVYAGEKAYLLCLWALKEYREWSIRLAAPVLRPLARIFFATLARGRYWISWFLLMKSDAELRDELRREPQPTCAVPPRS